MTIERCQQLSKLGNTHQFLSALASLVSIPAVAKYLDGIEPSEYSRCFNHKGQSRTVLHIYQTETCPVPLDNYFYCMDAECRASNGKRTQGDVTEYYTMRVNQKQHTFDTQRQAGQNLLQKVVEGLIDVSVTRCRDGKSESESDSESEGAFSPTTTEYCEEIRLQGRVLRSIKIDPEVLQQAERYKEPPREDLLWVPSSTIVKVLIRDHPVDSSYVRFSMRAEYDGGHPFLVRDWLATERYQRNCHKWAFLFPNCFIAPRAIRPNALPSRWLVLEKDEQIIDPKTGLDIDERIWKPEKEKQPGLYHWLSTQRIATSNKITLEMIFDSGRRSYHSFWDRGTATDEQVFEFFKVARLLGIDPVTIRPELRVRMPNGTRFVKTLVDGKEMFLKVRQAVVWMSDRFKWFCNNTKYRHE